MLPLLIAKDEFPPREELKFSSTKELREVIKRVLGYNTNQVSVKADSGLLQFMKLTIRRTDVDIAKVYRFAKHLHTYHVDNTDYAEGQAVNVDLSDEVQAALIESMLQLTTAAADCVKPRTVVPVYYGAKLCASDDHLSVQVAGDVGAKRQFRLTPHGKVPTSTLPALALEVALKLQRVNSERRLMSIRCSKHVRDPDRFEQKTPEEWFNFDRKMRSIEAARISGVCINDQRFYQDNLSAWRESQLPKDPTGTSDRALRNFMFVLEVAKAGKLTDPGPYPVGMGGPRNIGIFLSHIERATIRQLPVNALAVETYGLSLPPEYVKIDELYLVPPLLTMREILDETVAFYAEDIKRRAVDTAGTCRYETPDGRRCAVGRCLIPGSFIEDGRYLTAMRAATIGAGDIGNLEEILKPEYKGHPATFWRALQGLIHDPIETWNDTGLSSIGEERVRLLKQAIDDGSLSAHVVHQIKIATA